MPAGLAAKRGKTVASSFLSRAANFLVIPDNLLTNHAPII